MTKPSLDLRCYFVTGQGEDVVERARQAAAGGAGVIQVRSKPITARELYALSRAVAEAAHSVNPQAHVLIDDRADVAAALRNQGIAGVHVGQDDLDVRVVRELLGPDAIIGLTTGTLELVQAANEHKDVIDYIGCGPFRATPTKDSGRAPIGLDGYPDLVAASKLPLVAIVRGIMHADDAKAYCERVIAEFERGAQARAATSQPHAQTQRKHP